MRNPLCFRCQNDNGSVDRWRSVPKFVELIGVALNASCTNLNPEGTRRHIRAAFHEGATREEILLVLKMASLMSIQSCGLGGSSLLEEASEASLDAAGVGRAKRLKEAGGTTPAIDKMKAIGQWNEAWGPILAFDPVWTDQFMATVVGFTRVVFSHLRRSNSSASPWMHRTRTCTRPAHVGTSKMQ
jgi:hypothetical protein